MTRCAVEKYIERKEKLFGKFYDEFKVRFNNNLKSYKKHEDGTYLLPDLDRAWKKAESKNPYDDRGLIFVK
ncbi:hypothetical protein [Photobacterium leiognathi]|uniref:hypothetical protein n=1 Tax=Photobacterium leiognathi TaxID=553611 RepID=UPI000D170D26|nr:hypothetical protein [Photobacterium leiognathi]PSW50607.1 hypothetical protein C0W50_20440 [Photobacterium leiognathi subsp. mandapamensis]